VKPLDLFNDARFRKGWTDYRKGRPPLRPGILYEIGRLMAAEAKGVKLPLRATRLTNAMKAALKAAPSTFPQAETTRVRLDADRTRSRSADPKPPRDGGAMPTTIRRRERL